MVCILGSNMALDPNKSNSVWIEEVFVVFLDDSVQRAVDLIYTENDQPDYYQSEGKLSVYLVNLC